MDHFTDNTPVQDFPSFSSSEQLQEDSIESSVKSAQILWKKNGDCPGDDDRPEVARYLRNEEGAIVKFFRKPEISGLEFCPLCKNVYHNHGQVSDKIKLIDNRDVKYKGMVCPGTWLIVTSSSVEILSKEESQRLGLQEK